MSARYPNPNLVKIHRSYTVEEVAAVCRKHKNTVREWLKLGLPVCDEKRPTLVLGRDLVEFLKVRRVRNKQTCKPGEIYCVKCRIPRKPAGAMVEYKPVTEKIGNLMAICPACDSIMNRRISLVQLRQFQGEMDITFPQALGHIGDSSHPTVNSDLK